MNVAVSKWGNSLGIRIPKAVAQELHLREGSSLTLDPHPEGFLLKTAGTPMVSYLLNDLLALKQNESEETEMGWEDPVGDEAW